MRLIKRLGDGNLSLTRYMNDDAIPPYAILSHTWGPDSEEVSFRDLVEGTGKEKTGYRKIRFCADQANREGLRYFWVDTCCIDKSSNVESAEAINSAFRLYRNATRCYVYLSDVSVMGYGRGNYEPWDYRSWESAFRASRWFTRGWTLLELLAPASVQFFSREGELLGDKTTLKIKIHEITGIDIPALCGNPLDSFDIGERLKWAEKRQTTFEEDWVYSLLGIFGISMPPIYGEGKENAVQRLRKAIKDTYGEELFKKSYCYIPFSKNKRFVGRQAILEELKYLLFINPYKSVAIVGLGGIGKTQVALQMAYWVKEKKPDYSVFWVPAMSNEKFKQAFAEIAEKLAIHKIENQDPRETVRRYLSSEAAGKWLLVVDNADDAQLLLGSKKSDGISKYLPHSKDGFTLFTTRSHAVAISVAGGDVMELLGMSQEEAKIFLEKSIIRKELLHDETSATILLDKLNYHPQAIKEAAAYINTKQGSIVDYLKLVDSTPQGVVEDRSPPLLEPSQNFAAEEGMLLTDSGYASGPNAKYISPGSIDKADFQCIMGVDSNGQGEVNGIDTRTEYSTATTTFQARAYISDLCNDIYGKFRDYTDIQDWPWLSKVLPDLIKAFALKIGQENDAQLNRDVMYFIHKHHMKLFTQLQDLFLYQNDELAADSHKSDPESMSVFDKMNLWANLAQSQQSWSPVTCS